MPQKKATEIIANTNEIAFEKNDSGDASMISCRQEQVLKLIYSSRHTENHIWLETAYITISTLFLLGAYFT